MPLHRFFHVEGILIEACSKTLSYESISTLVEYSSFVSVLNALYSLSEHPLELLNYLLYLIDRFLLNDKNPYPLAYFLVLGFRE